MKKRLNGYWSSKSDPAVTVYVEKVFKKGYVTGFHYKKLAEGGECISPLKITHVELEDNYEKR